MPENENTIVEEDYTFIDRKKDAETLIYVLAGYKPFLWDIVFKRLKAFYPKDSDFCIVSSGLYSEKLAALCEENSWSYLYTKRNCLTLAQNLVIESHPEAQWIYKVDEDIFVTDGCFEALRETYLRVGRDSQYQDGGIAVPLIPVNGYGYVRILEKLHKAPLYTQKFNRPVKYDSGHWYPEGVWRPFIEGLGEAAEFMWGLGDSPIPQLDELNRRFQRNLFNCSICSIRFSIGMFFCNRSFWINMGKFHVDDSSGLGKDEEQIVSYCALDSRPISVSENTVVGHLSFGWQTEHMQQVFADNTDWFDIQ